MASQDGKIRKSDLVENDAIKVYGELKDEAVSTMKAITDAINKLQQARIKLNTTENEQKKITNELNIEMKKMSIASKQAKDASDALLRAKKLETAEINKQKAAIQKDTAEKKANTNATKSQDTASKGLIGTFKNLLKSMLAFIGVRMFFQFIKDTFELTKKLDSLNFAMLAITKTQEGVAKNQAFLARITKAYGAEIVSTTERYIRFLAAAKQSNVALKDTQNIFETFTKVSGVLGLNTQDLTGIFLALEQMLSKGKVTTEELRRQLGERLPGAMGIMATSLGVTIPQLDIMLKKGEVLSAEVLPEFARQVELSFGINSVTKVETLSAAWTRLKNKFVEIFSEFASGSNLAKKLSLIIDVLSENFADILKGIFSATKAFIAYQVVIGILSIKTALLTLNTKLLAQAKAIETAQTKAATVANWTFAESWAALNTVMKANMIGIIVSILAVAITAFDYFSISLEDTIKNLNKTSKEFIEASYKAADVAESINKMADSYDNLKNRVEAQNRSLSDLNNGIKINEAQQERLNKQIKDGVDINGELAETLRLVKNEHVDLIDATIEFKDAQTELDRITKALATSFPDAITSQNDYGDASGINTEKVKELNKVLQEQALLKAGINIDIQEKEIKNLENYIKGREDYVENLKKTNELNSKQKVFLFEEINAKKQLLIETKMQLKANEDLIFSFSEEGIAKRKKDEDDAKIAAEKIANIKKEAEGIKNIVNLTNANNKLTEERSLLERSNKGVVEENGKISTKTHDKRIDEINDEIIANQKLIDAITGKKIGGSTKELTTYLEGSIGWLEKMISKNNSLIKQATDNTTRTKLREENILLQEQLDKLAKARELVKKVETTIIGIADEKLEIKIPLGIEINYNDIKASLEEILDLASEFNNALGDLSSAFSDRRLEQIDAEIDAETKKYDALIALAENDKSRKEALEKEKADALAKLDKKRLKEEQKAAKIRKATALIDIAINTAVAYTKTLAQAGGVFGIPLATIVLALGAVQAATVLAQPIPQYKDGLDLARTDHTAMINDGGKREFIERNGKIFSSPIKNAIVDIEKGDTVHKDINSLMNSSIINSLANDNKNLDINKLRVIFDANYSNLEGAITKSLSKAKFNNNIRLNGFDSGQEAYRNSQSRWS